MEPTKNFSNFLDSSSTSSVGSTGKTTGKTFSTFLDEPQADKPAGSLEDLIAQEGADAIKPLVQAIYKQESGSGANAKTSTNGAVGGMQIMPATFQQYAKPGERIDNQSDNLRVGVRIIKDLVSKFGNDPAKVAAGYFSGAGNVNQGTGSAWKNDHADANGKRVSSYVADVLNSMGLGQGKPGVDLSKAPKWADIEASDKFQALDDNAKQQAKQAYFDYWIAPNAGDKAEAYRAQFMGQKPPGAPQAEGSLWDTVKGVGKSVVDALTPSPSLLEQPYGGERPRNPNETLAPVSHKFKAQIESQWDAATPEQRAQMEAKPGVIGMLARQRAGLYQSGPSTETGKQFDPRVESRTDALIKAGEDGRFAKAAAQFGAAMGVQPGKEVQSMPLVQASGYDFDTQDAFGAGPSNGLNNPLTRGLAKGGLGISKAIAGYGEFLSDLYGLEDAQRLTKGAGKWARGKEEAIGESGDMLSRNLEGAISSIAQQLPLLVTGVAAGSRAIPLAGMAVQAFGQEYSDGRAKGQTTEQAAARAGIFAAFEVIGERFGLKANMAGLKALAEGKAADEVLRLFASAMAKDIPGELLTTTGQFATDKFAPGGVGLNPTGTLEQYAAALADTFVQTIMQSAIMGGAGYIKPTWNALKGGQQLGGQIEADAMRARDVALGNWESGGLTVGLGNRAEPVAAPQHQMVTDAQAVVAELANAAGLPLETVLPTPVVAPTEVESTDLPPANEPGNSAVTDRDVLTLADARYQQLREKREGSISIVAGDDGVVDHQAAPVGLTKREQQEMAALEQNRGDVHALRKLYGLDQTDLAEAEAVAEREAIQADDTPVDLPQQQDDDIPGFDTPDTTKEVGNATQATQAQQAEPAQEVRSQDQDQPVDRGTEARQEPSVSATGSTSLEANGLTQKAPKTEKEAKQRKAIDRIAKGSAYFGSQEKATGWIADNGLASTHEAKKTGASRWDVVAKGNGRDTRTQAVFEASKAAAKALENGGTDADAMRAATDSLIESMDDAPGISVSQDAPAALEAAKQSKQDAPGTRYATDADRAGAERLEKLLEVFQADRNTPAGQARSAIRSVIEDLRKPKTVVSVEAVLQAAAQKLDRQHGPQADVVREVLEQIDQRKGTDSPGGAQGEQAGGSRPTPAASEKFANNKIFTADKVAAARARMKAKLGQMNSGLDPELMVDGATIAGAYIESGVRKYSEYAKAMVEDFGDKIRPYLRSFYEAVRHYPGLDTTGMTTAAEIDLMEKQGTAEHTKEAKGTEAVVGTVAKVKKKTERAPSDKTLRTDWGVSHIDGWATTDEFNGEQTDYGMPGGVKDAFLKDTSAYLKDVAKKLEQSGFAQATRAGKAIKPVNVNESGVAGSGDVTLAMFNPTMGKGVYITIGETAIRGAVPTTKSGIAVMMRVTNERDPYGGSANIWVQPTLTSAELADLAAREVEKNSTQKPVEPAKTVQDEAQPTTTAADLHTQEGKFKVAKTLADEFIGGASFATIVEVRKRIGELIGKKIDPATELAKQADEAVEVAVVLAAREMIAAGRKQGRTSQVIYDRLFALFKAQPNLAVRSSTSMRDQAYSTPVPLAFVASELAGVTADTKMIESTAGNGMLAIGATLGNATVNELNPKRAAMLDAMGFKPTTENAATATLAPARSMDAVVINPPFGATKDDQGNTIVYEIKPNYGTREVDHAIVFKTLEAMKDDGRAVLIVGGVMSEEDEARREDYRGKNKRTFYFNLYNDYNVVDHFTVDGSLYAKQGASYPVDVIVIKGRGKSSRDLPAAELPHIIRSYDELKEKLNVQSSLGARGTVGADVADSGAGREGGANDTQNVAGSPGTAGGRSGATSQEPRAGGAAGVRGDGAGRVDGQPQPGGPVSPVEQLEPESLAGRSGDRQGSVRGEGAGKQGSKGSTGNNGLPTLGGPGVVSGERVQSGLTDRRGEEQETATQVAYTPHSAATSVGTLVPRAMKDAIEGSLQRLADEVGDLDQYVADSLAMDPETLRTNFSAEQVDALALSIRNAEAGKGFIIGDQTGIGKGRVVAAMIRYALINDKTPVFVTEKPNLYSDMIRDLDDIGMTDDLGLDTNNPRIFITNSDETIPYTLLRTEGDEVIENNLTLKPAKRGAALNDLMQSMMNGESLGDYKVIFTTYSQMQTVKGAETTRQKFVKQFGAGNYMIFDESHNAGGAGETQARTKEQRKAEKAGQSLVTGRAAFVRELVSSAFGTFFSSATYAKRPDVMDLYSSTNMSLAVDKIADLGSAIKEGGVPMQQVVANMLTQDGQYIRRERTFAGVSYDTVPTTVDKQTAENMASAMRSILSFSRRKDVLLAQMQKEADKQGAMLQAVGGAKTSIEGANFGAIMHNLIDQMLLALKVESSVKHAIERLKAGEKVVLTVSNTMGSFLKEYADEMGLNNGDVVGLSFGDLYQRYLEKQRIIRIKRPGGEVEQKRLTDAELGPELTQMFNDIQTQIRKSGFGSAPISPIDYMHTELRKAGFKTDEITGRTMTLNYVDGAPTLASRAANIKQRVNAVRGFNNGDLDVLILNQAGSTGLSLHAASKFKDKRKRHMIIVQAEKNIDTHMQMLGRVHRTGQVVTPAYSQMMADIPAEVRPAAVLLKKMASLNANTTASRKSAVTAEGVVDFMNDYGGQVVHEFLRDNPEVHASLGGNKVLKLVDESEDATEDDIRKLTGYIPILPIGEQERIYSDLIQRYNELIERENSLGTNKLEAKALDLEAETIKVKPLTEQKDDPSIFAAPANMELVDVKRTVKPFSSEEVRASVTERLAGKTGAMVASAAINDLRARTQAFIDERMKKAEAAENADPVRLADQRMLLTMTMNRATSILQTFSIGDSVSVADTATGVLYGVITDISASGRTANPAAGSDWKMTVALANGDAKSITINFSQIGGRYKVQQERMVNWYNAETQQGEQMRVIDIFDKGSRVRREKRWIVTGNILAGFSKFKGQIISYTKKDGTVGQGVLMSRQFDFDKEMRGMKVGMRNAAAALEFLKKAGLNSTIGTEDGNFKIVAGRGQYTALTPSAKRIGGNFYLDDKLTRAIGGDFYKRGTNMSAVIPQDSILDVLDYLINERGETLVALTHNDVARKLAGLEETEEKSKGDGVKFNTQNGNGEYNQRNEKAEIYPQQRTERTARNMRSFQAGVLRDLSRKGHHLRDDVTYFVPVVVPQAREISEIARAFGTEIQWFDLKEGLTANERLHVGKYIGANLGGIQYIKATGVDRPHLAVLGHELAHELKKKHPDLYDQFVDAVNAFIKPGAYPKFLNEGVAKNAKDPREEFSGEVLSDLFMERKFWQSMGERSPTLLQKIADLVLALAEKLMQTVGYTKRSAPYLSDFQKVMDIAEDVMRQFASRVEKATQNDEIRFATTSSTGKLMELTRKAQNNLIHFFGNQNLDTFNWYDKSIATQYHKALKDPHFGKVYQLLLGMQNHVSMASVRAAQMAPGVLPRVDDAKTAVKELFSVKSREALDKASMAIFSGTLAGESVLDGVVWSPAQLRSNFQMDETAIALYYQARAAIDSSLDEVAAAEAYSMAHKIVPKSLRADIIERPEDASKLISDEINAQIKTMGVAIAAAKKAGDNQTQDELSATRDSYKSTLRQIEAIFIKALNLKNAGYAPLMRFGKYTVEVQPVDPQTGLVERDDDGKPMTIYFGRFETQADARRVQADMDEHYKNRDDIRVSAGSYNDSKHEIYSGVTPETLELFADAIGAGTAADEYIRLVKSDRSALKRQLERKGTPGFSTDVSRVLSNFITSNARHAAQQFYMQAINNAVKYIPKEKGDVQKEAQKLRKFVIDPKDAGAIGSSLMFAWFLGGSPAAAAVNATQPLMVTLPYLSQFVSPEKAAAELTKATPAAMGKAEIADADLRDALRRASLEGAVDAQEIFHLYSLGSRQLALGTKSQAALTLWGSMFSAVEGLNRRLTFIAAWNIAKQHGNKAPYAFAIRAVNSTQGIYNKVNRPNFARHSVGRLVFTYKGYAFMVMELMTRMWKSGPEGKKAVAIMLAMLLLASGEEGLPGAKALDDIIDTIGQWMDYDTNMRRFKRRHAYEILGKAWGDFLLYGASSQLPLDFGGRLGLGSMIPGTELLKTSSTNQHGKAVGEIVGPSAGMAQQVGNAVEAAAEGNYGQAAQNLAPKAVRDVAAGLSMVRKGYATDAVGRKVVDVGLSDAAIKAIGFQPTVIANEHRKGMPIQQDIALQQKTEASIVANWAQGIVNKDENMVDQARAKMEKWNKDNPDSAIAISPSQIKSRVKMLLSDKENRTLHKAPKEMRGRVGLDLADD